MIIIKLQGGLGNQMFQYAFASILAKNNNDTILTENNFFSRVEKEPGFTPRIFELGIFSNCYTKASDSDIRSFHHLSNINKIKRKLGLCYPKIYKEPSFDFHNDALAIKSPVYLKGYFQSYKYFIDDENFIRQLFSFPINKLDEVNKELLIKIKSSNAIAIHIRRGDFVYDKITAEYHGNCSLDYFREAIELLALKNKNFTFLFFSDDSDWVKNQFNDLAYSKIFVDHNKGENSWKDMLLMSSCNHNIIANSSFSWWAAWLNENPEKIVIAPRNWFAEAEKGTNDLIPIQWIQL